MQQNTKRFKSNPSCDTNVMMVEQGDGPSSIPGTSGSTMGSLQNEQDKSAVKIPETTRADVLKLMRQKDEIEAEVKALEDILNSQHGVGMDGPLLDSEGFPRSDIDVYTVRHARHKIICLTNDHKDVMKQIEEGLYCIHAQARSEYMDVDASEPKKETHSKPFAKVQFVTPESPAAAAGLQSGDLVIAFGSANQSSFRSLNDLATIVNNSENQSLSIEIIRNGTVKRVTLVPKRWTGRGLLGCSFLEERAM